MNGGVVEEAPGPFPARSMLPEALQADPSALDQVTPEELSSRHCREASEFAETVRNDNDERAGRALDALLTYYRGAYRCEVVSSVFGDFLADLQHLCDAVGGDWNDLLRRGQTHHDAEVYGVL